MAINTDSVLTQQFVTKLSAEMGLIEPSPEYIFAKMISLGFNINFGLQNNAIPATAAMSSTVPKPELPGFVDAPNGSLDLNPTGKVAAELAIQLDVRGKPGKTFQINRPQYLSGSATESDHVRTPGSPPASLAESISLSMDSESMTVKSYWGPHSSASTAGVKPIGIDEFLKDRSEQEILSYVLKQLILDYSRFLNARVTALYAACYSSYLTVCTGGGGTAAAASMATGTNQVTDNDVQIALEAITDRQWPNFPTGKKILFAPIKFMTMLRRDSTWREVLRYPTFDGGRPLMEGHVTDYNGLHIVQVPTLSTDTVGTSEGLPSGVTGYQGFIVGPQALGRVVAKDVRAAYREDTNFQTEDALLWKSDEIIQTLDERGVQVVFAS